MSQSFQSSYMGLFLDELDEQLQVLEQMLLQLENGGDPYKIIQTIFRAAHTLKGSSAAMGFEKIKELTHKLESIFDLLRSSELQLDSRLIDVIFRSLDHLKEQREELLQGNMEELSIEMLLHELEPFISGESAPPLFAAAAALEAASASAAAYTDAEAEVGGMALLAMFQEQERMQIKEYALQGKPVLLIEFEMMPDVQMAHARCMLLFDQLREHGELLGATPSYAELQEERGTAMKLTVALSSYDEVQRMYEEFAQESYLCSTRITELCTDSGAPAPAQQPLAPLVQAQAAVQSAASETDARQAAAQPYDSKPAGQEPKQQVASQTVRVDVNRLELLIDLVGELIIDQTRLEEVGKQLRSKFRNEPETELFDDILNHLNRVVGDLQNGMLKARMLPIEQLFNRLPRLSRDLALQAGKEIDLHIEGKETELDRTLIEELGDPLIHILRNAADHGIEPPNEREKLGKPRKGQVLLKAAHQENTIVITISDDGRGIDPERIKKKAIQKGFVTEEEVARMSNREIISLIFHSGMSTAEQVTELSGRGVGMDIVRSHIEKIRGIIEIDTTLGKGTVFTIKLPLTLAIIRSLLIENNKKTMAIPLVNVLEIFRIHPQDIKTVSGQEVCLVRGEIVPLVQLKQLLNQEVAEETDAETSKFVVMIGMADKRVCLQVDRPLGNQEIVMKSLGAYVGQVPFISGSTILGNGEVALILDVAAIIKGSGTLRNHADAFTENSKNSGARTDEGKIITFLLQNERYGLGVEFIKEITTVPPITPLVHAVQNVLGLINLRGTLLPLYHLGQCLGKHVQLALSSSARVIVIEINGKQAGVLVDEVCEVLTISQERIEPVPDYSMKSNVHPLTGIYQNADQLVMLLDIHQVITAPAEYAVEEAAMG